MSSMGDVFDPTPEPGSTPIEAIEIEFGSRDDISKILLDLQAICGGREVREKLFALLIEPAC